MPVRQDLGHLSLFRMWKKEYKEKKSTKYSYSKHLHIIIIFIIIMISSKKRKKKQFAQIKIHTHAVSILYTHIWDLWWWWSMKKHFYYHHHHHWDGDVECCLIHLIIMYGIKKNSNWNEKKYHSIHQASMGRIG